MRHHNSVFHDLLKHIPWTDFADCVDEHGADRRVRRLTTKSQLVALLYGQLAGATSLRDIERALQSHETRLYHLGVRRPARSTLADANATRPWQVFADLFGVLVGQAGRRVRRDLADQVRLLDATKVSLSPASAAWARFSDDFTAAKIHVVHDPRAGYPVHACVTPHNVNDITPAKGLTLEPGLTPAFAGAGYMSLIWLTMITAGGLSSTPRDAVS